MHGILAPEDGISKQEKPVPMFWKHVFRHYKFDFNNLNIWKHFQIVRVKRQENLENKTVISVHTYLL